MIKGIMAAIEPSQLGWVIIGQGIKPPTIRTVTSFRSDSERAAEDDRVGSCAILPAIIVASAGDLGKAAPEIKRQCRLVIGGHLEKGRICPAHGGFLDKEAEGGRGTPLAATVRVGGEGQDFRFVEDNSGQQKTGGITDVKDRRVGKKAAELVGAPAAGILKGQRVGGGKGRGQIAHGRITGGASREGAASAART